MHSSNALYTDLSGYYDLMCADIDYQAQSQSARRLHQFFGGDGRSHLDLACGTGPHIRHFLDAGYQSSGLDLNQPMLDKALLRCPEASFMQQNMCDFELAEQVDLITCFLYSIHYSASIKNLQTCIASVVKALKPGGVLGVVEHRLPADKMTGDWQKSGYFPQALTVSLAEQAGFVFEAASEINANPKDTADHPGGVWTLPPVLRLKEQDKDKYLAIGESDRMTLKFRKPVTE